MRRPEKTIEEMALMAREIATVVIGELSRANPTETCVLKRVADLAQDIERKALCFPENGDRQGYDLVEIVGVISMISGLLNMLALLHK